MVKSLLERLQLPVAVLAAPLTFVLGYGGSTKVGSEFWNEVLVMVAGAPVLAWFGMGWLIAKSKGLAFSSGVDARGLPVMEWEAESRGQGRGIAVPYTAKAKRRCHIEIGRDGTALFVHEVVQERRPELVPFRPLLGMDGVKIAEKLMDRYGVAKRENVGGAPWAALQAFRLTTDAEYYGLSTRGGDPLKPNQINHIVVAEFGVEWGDMIIAESKTGPAPMRELHRRLTLEFVNGRPAHLERLRAAASGGPAGSGRAGPATRPETL